MPKTRWILLGAGLLIAAAAISTLLSNRLWQGRDASYTTYASSPSGCKALYLVLRELNLPVERLRKAYSTLHRHSGVLVIIHPTKVFVSRREVKKLKEWVRKGNRLVIFEGADRAPLWLTPAEADTKEERPRSSSITFWNVARHFGLKIVNTGSQGRDIVPVSIPGLKEKGRISVSRSARWRKPADDWTILAEDERGPVLAVQDLGKGKVAALCDPTLPANRHISSSDNFKLTMALLLGKEPRKPILFDEYHHGYITHDSLGNYVASSIFGWILLQGVAGFVLFVYSRRAQCSGRYLTSSRPVGRSSLEHVDSMANIFESCKAGSAALEAIFRRFVSQVSRQSGIRRAGSDQADVKGPTISGGSGELDNLVRECRSAIESESGPETALTLARRLSEAENKMRKARIVMPRRRR